MEKEEMEHPTTPGIYLLNATGDMVPLATEDRSGDTDLLREALAEYHILVTNLEEKYPVIETGLQENSVTFDARFGGHCNKCDIPLDSVQNGSFGQLVCSGCGYSVAPTIYPIVGKGESEPAPIVEDWPSVTMEGKMSDADVTVGRAIRARCNDCGEPLRRNVADVEFGGPYPLTCVECEYTFGWSLKWNEKASRSEEEVQG